MFCSNLAKWHHTEMSSLCRYENVLMKLLEPHSFKYELRCSRETFDEIVQDLHNHMAKENTLQ